MILPRSHVVSHRAFTQRGTGFKLVFSKFWGAWEGELVKAATEGRAYAETLLFLRAQPQPVQAEELTVRSEGGEWMKTFPSCTIGA